MSVFANPAGVEAAAIHNKVNARRQSLDEGERAAQVEETVRAPELIRNHGAGEHNRFAFDARSKHAGGFRHGIRAVRDDDARLGNSAALLDDQVAVGIRHVEAVHHHEGPQFDGQATAAERKHLGQMRILEKEPAVDLVVFLVKGSTSDEDANALVRR